MFRAGLLSGSTLAKAGIAHNQLERVKEELSGLVKGWSKDEIEDLVTETVDEVVTPLVFAEALAIIDQHKRDGHRVVVISASPEEIVRPLCRYLGIDDVIATRSEVDDEGLYTGNIEFYAYGPTKAEAMEEMAQRDGIDLAASYAYSDSATDLPMLEIVGHPIVVNPDAELAQAAEDNGWEVRTFESAVTLRDRIGTKEVAGAAVATGMAAVLAYWAMKGRKTS